MSVRSIMRITGVMLCWCMILGCGKSGVESQNPEITFRQSGCLEGLSTTFLSLQHDSQLPYIAEVTSSGCLDTLKGTFGDPLEVNGNVRFEVSHDTVFVCHDSAFYNCCSSIIFTVEQNGQFLDFVEIDTSSTPCFCMCYFDLRAAAAGVTAGTYTARLWTEDREDLLGEAELTVPGSGIAWFETRCDTLIVYNNAYHTNCGAIFVFDFVQQGSLLTFAQLDTSSMWMHCMCDFNLQAQVTGLPDGEYTVRLRDSGNVHDMGGVVDSLIAEATVSISCP